MQGPLGRPVHATDIFKAVARLHLHLTMQVLNVLPIGNHKFVGRAAPLHD